VRPGSRGLEAFSFTPATPRTPLGKKILETEILKEALEHAAGSKKQLRLPPSLPKDGSR
jgi:hypothetical protein